MRTTIQLPDSIWQKLMTEAAARHRKGFSDIIVEALRKYFNEDQKKNYAVKMLRGCMNKAEYKNEMARVEEARKNWRE